MQRCREREHTWRRSVWQWHVLACDARAVVSKKCAECVQNDYDTAVFIFVYLFVVAVVVMSHAARCMAMTLAFACDARAAVSQIVYFCC